jgi:hypothetical protein
MKGEVWISRDAVKVRTTDGTQLEGAAAIVALFEALQAEGLAFDFGVDKDGNRRKAPMVETHIGGIREIEAFHDEIHARSHQQERSKE